MRLRSADAPILALLPPDLMAAVLLAGPAESAVQASATCSALLAMGRDSGLWRSFALELERKHPHIALPGASDAWRCELPARLFFRLRTASTAHSLMCGLWSSSWQRCRTAGSPCSSRTRSCTARRR